MDHAGQTMCIVLMPRGCEEASLRAAASERGWRIHSCSSALQAIAELAVRERAQAARSAWGLPRVDTLAFAIVNPREWTEFHDLLHALARYFPSIERFAFADGRFTTLAVPTDAGVPIRRLPLLPRRAGAVRPVNQQRSAADVKSEDADGIDSTVTREELDILLGAREERT